MVYRLGSYAAQNTQIAIRIQHRGYSRNMAAGWDARAYTPRHDKWPYNPADFERYDSSPDTVFYQPSRLVAHIDDNAIKRLSQYYAQVLPSKGTILDFCSSWISHLPADLEPAIRTGDLKVVGMGMNQTELDANPVLSRRVLKDLNEDPTLPPDLTDLDAATCVVSIDYLTEPVEVLKSIHERLKTGSSVHLAISNRCFPTKAIQRWLEIDEEERLQLVGDYLWFAGFRNIETLTLSDGTIRGGSGLSKLFGRCDPLWIVRGKKE